MGSVCVNNVAKEQGNIELVADKLVEEQAKKPEPAVSSEIAEKAPSLEEQFSKMLESLPLPLAIGVAVLGSGLGATPQSAGLQVRRPSFGDVHLAAGSER